MGIVTSYFHNTPQSNEPDPITGLTPKEIALVQNSWALVKKDLMGAGIEMFLLYFQKFPEYQNYFPFRNIPLEELRTSKKLHAHATNVIYALSAAIDNLQNNEVLVNLLTNSGQSHGKRNIPEKAYWDLKLCIMELLEKTLGTKLTPDGKAAWDKTLSVAISVIIQQLPEHAAKQ